MFAIPRPTHVIAALMLAIGWAIAPVPSHAQDAGGPVVVELFTSQGCSSCPPADKLLHELSERDGIIALALHVDYWDYIGWKDVFARPEHADRQRAYAHHAGKSMIYTPQMVIDGQAHVVGNKPMDVADIITEYGGKPNAVTVELSRAGDTLSISAVGATGGPVDLHLVRFSARETVDIKRGENRGKRLSYANIVRDWHALGQWDGNGNFTMKAQVSADLPLAVLVQAVDHGAILGAAVLR